MIRDGQRVLVQQSSSAIMSLTRTAINQNRITITVISLLPCWRVYLPSRNIPKAQDPGFTIRTAVITTRFPGASPQRVEELVTDKIEKKVQEMPEIDNILSESRTGISIITVNFKESYKVMRPIFDDLRRKVETPLSMICRKARLSL